MNSIRLFVFLIIGTSPFLARADPAAEKLLAEGQRELTAMKSSNYRHKTSVDESAGRFNFDCSGFLDYALARASSDALAELPLSRPKSRRALAQDYFKLFSNPLPSSSHWTQVARATELMPGDVIAWLLPPGSKSRDTCHTMLVVEAAKMSATDARQILVKVIDSTVSPHASDSRGKNQSGPGTGTISILNDESNTKPVGFYWRANESKKPKLTQIVFGRLKN